MVLINGLVIERDFLILMLVLGGKSHGSDQILNFYQPDYFLSMVPPSEFLFILNLANVVIQKVK